VEGAGRGLHLSRRTEETHKKAVFEPSTFRTQVRSVTAAPTRSCECGQCCWRFAYNAASIFRDLMSKVCIYTTDPRGKGEDWCSNPPPHLWECWTKTCIYTNTHRTHHDPDDGGSIYLRNVDINHIHTEQSTSHRFLLTSAPSPHTHVSFGLADHVAWRVPHTRNVCKDLVRKL
jgi:hypothetical protein